VGYVHRQDTFPPTAWAVPRRRILVPICISMEQAAIPSRVGEVRIRRFPELVLLLVSLVWGGTFLVSQTALVDGGPFGLLAARFTIGTLVLFCLFFRRMAGLERHELNVGLVLGVVTFAAFALQTVGLQHIASSKSAFITAFYVPAVPLLQLTLLAVMPRLAAWMGIAVSFTGLVVLAVGDGVGFTFGSGEWLTLGGAFGAALGIVLLSRWAPETDPIRLAIVQLGLVAALSFVALPLTGEPLPHLTPRFLLCALALGVLGTAFALTAMIWAQKTVSATRATVIYAMEPVWAGVFGAIAGEVISGAMVAGSALIIAGILVSELPGGASLRRMIAERRWPGRVSTKAAPAIVPGD
jgi:drug/metabolite transporter (DMT)-like permease